jgi:amylosucrase
VLADTDDGVLAVLRHHPAGAFHGLYNFTDEPRPFPAERLASAGIERPHDALAGADVVPDDGGNVVVPPLGAMWVVPGVGF